MTISTQLDDTREVYSIHQQLVDCQEDLDETADPEGRASLLRRMADLTDRQADLLERSGLARLTTAYGTPARVREIAAERRREAGEETR